MFCYKGCNQQHLSSFKSRQNFFFKYKHISTLQLKARKNSSFSF